MPRADGSDSLFIRGRSHLRCLRVSQAIRRSARHLRGRSRGWTCTAWAGVCGSARWCCHPHAAKVTHPSKNYLRRRPTEVLARCTVARLMKDAGLRGIFQDMDLKRSEAGR
jgi:hypothetical protein